MTRARIRSTHRSKTLPARVLGVGLAAIALATLAGASLPARAHAARPHADIVRVPFPEDEGNLTPYSFGRGFSLMTLVYDTVLWRDADGVPRPWLAGAIDVSPDQTTITIHIAPGARWQDGPPVTSEDIAFTFRYVRAHSHPRFTPELDAVASVETPDATTAVVRLAHPAPGFLEEPLSDVPIIPEHLWASLSPDRTAPAGPAVGSGPYRLVSHDPGTIYRFQAVPGYFRGPPAAATIEVPIIRDASATVAALERHEVDALPFSVSSDEAQGLGQDLGVRLDTGTSFAGTVLMINTRRPPFDLTDVRHAVAQAIDLAALARAADGGLAAERGYLHPDSGWAPDTPTHRYDPAGARAVLAGLGGHTVRVLAPDNDAAQAQAGRQIVLALQRVGVTAQLQTISVEALDAAVGASGSAPTFELAIWTAPSLASYDPGLLPRLFGSGAALNFSGYASDAFDSAAGRAGAATDPVARHAAVADELRQLAADAPVLPLYFPRGIFAVRPAVYDGWVYVKGAGIFDKLSFVQPADAQGPAASVSASGPSSAAPLSALLWVAFGLVALAAIAAAARIIWSRL